MKIDIEEYYTVEDIAEYLKVSKITIIRRIKDKLLSSDNIGTKDKPNYRIRGDMLIDFITHEKE